MKLFSFISLFVFIACHLKAQNIQPENVVGKISMCDGYNQKVNGNNPVPGHDISDNSDPKYLSVSSDFTGIDANMMKLFGIIKVAPDLNPPKGFDAWYQMETDRREAAGVYSGKISVWMFSYFVDSGDPNKIDLSSETNYLVYAFVNNPTSINGVHEYFTDTLHYSPAKGKTVISLNDDQDIEIIHQQKPLFRPYTIGEFLTRQKKFYEDELAENKDDLETDQSMASSASTGTNSAIKELNDNIKDLEDDIAGRQQDLKSADSENKSTIQSIIDDDKKNIETLKKTVEQLSSSGQQQLNNDLSGNYQSAVGKDQDSKNKFTQIIQQISNEYNHLSDEQKKQQAYIKPGNLFQGQAGMNTSDIWDEDFVSLLPPGDKSGTATYCYNLEYFDKTRSSDIQLIVMKVEAKGDEPMSKKQWEIIQQLNAEKLKTLIQG